MTNNQQYSNNIQTNKQKEKCEKAFSSLYMVARCLSPLTGKNYNPELMQIAILIKGERFFEAYGRILFLNERFKQEKAELENNIQRQREKAMRIINEAKKQKANNMVQKQSNALSVDN